LAGVAGGVEIEPEEELATDSEGRVVPAWREFCAHGRAQEEERGWGDDGVGWGWVRQCVYREGEKWTMETLKASLGE